MLSSNIKSVLALTIAIFMFLMFIIPASAQDQGVVEIPAIGVSAPIYHAPTANNTWDVSHLNMSVGRLEHLPWFGSNTNVVLAGHSTDINGNPDIFYNLSALAPGDVINVHTNNQTYSYVVASQEIISASNLSVLYPMGPSKLTLITCDPSSFDAGTELYNRRIVIHAYPA